MTTDPVSLVQFMQEMELRKRQQMAAEDQARSQEMQSAIGSLIQNRSLNTPKDDFRGRLAAISNLGLSGNSNGNPATTGLTGDMLMRGAIAKEFGIPYEDIQTPEYRQLKAEAAIKKDVAKKELSTMTTNLPKLDQAYQAIDQLEKLYYQGATPDKSPLKARTTGIFDAMGAKAGLNPTLNSYMNNSKAFAGLIAKGGFGESGMLTNEDINRVVSALPKAGSTAEEAKIGFAEVKKLLAAAGDRYKQKFNEYLGGGKASPSFIRPRSSGAQLGRFKVEVE